MKIKFKKTNKNCHTVITVPKILDTEANSINLSEIYMTGPVHLIRLFTCYDKQ